jgi:hypothetical protein
MVLPCLKQDLQKLIRERGATFREANVKHFMRDILEGMRYLHLVKALFDSLFCRIHSLTLPLQLEQDPPPGPEA